MDEKSKSELETENRTLILALGRICEMLDCTEKFMRILMKNMTSEEIKRATERYEETLNQEDRLL